MESLWNKEQEVDFFNSSRKIATAGQLFYLSDDKRYLAYWSKNYENETITLHT